ncbi:protein FREE1-like [Impatiens glandulifera]|uniref:protein FREE1-like n=1 Tax=Impatiens glandulifera TaxID=253017 RepID=UPI001FB1013E|nr:protein FREE1-like [Impatiens glandulifera]
MNQSDAASSPFYQYYNNSHLHNPNPNPTTPTTDAHMNSNSSSSFPATFASAPPFSSSFAPSDHHHQQSPYSSSSSSAPAYPPQYAPPDHASFHPNPTSHLPNPHYSAPPQLAPQPPPYNPYDQTYGGPSVNYTHQQQIPLYDPNPNPNPNSTTSNTSSYSTNLYPPPPPSDYGNSYLTGSNYGNYVDQGMHGGGGGGGGEMRSEVAPRYDYGGGLQDGGTESGVYRYSGSKTEPYGARGTGSASSGGSKSSSGALFDDYGRPIAFGDRKQQHNSLPQSAKIVKAAPKVESQQDMGSGVLKFRVKLLQESAGQIDMDILCQIGLDGIRLLDPTNYRTLRIYALDNITRWDVLDSYIFAFWAKSSVDADAKRIRLKSNSYTTNNILDAVTAASIQFKEIGNSFKSPDPKGSDQQSEKKKGLVDWMNIIKPKIEEKDHWVPDEAVKKCTSCAADFGAFMRRHHCRNCGDIFCDKCTQGRVTLTADDDAQTVRVCDRCMAEVTQRLANSKDRAAHVSPLQSHEDLARKLKEEMEKNRRSSTGFKSEGGGSGKRMKEVACPTCTVHLQVQVPASGSETIECSVCQHPFLVNSY